uniref:Uncharacterized protein n=1 Tax=Setaria viridis TaxID=4556 RepID=A0A4U6VZU5_SETVI|nr:hypothetical protein SEVIR_2G310700v2 [Setaria viridis]
MRGRTGCSIGALLLTLSMAQIKPAGWVFSPPPTVEWMDGGASRTEFLWVGLAYACKLQLKFGNWERSLEFLPQRASSSYVRVSESDKATTLSLPEIPGSAFASRTPMQRRRKCERPISSCVPNCPLSHHRWLRLVFRLACVLAESLPPVRQNAYAAPIPALCIHWLHQFTVSHHRSLVPACRQAIAGYAIASAGER